MKTRIVICGFSRSGTSILYTLLSNSIANISLFDREISALNVKDNRDICLTKRPLDCTILDKIFAKYSEDNVRIIFQIRDPRDAICSTHTAVPHDYFMSCLYQYSFNLEENTVRPATPGLRDLANLWLKHKDNPNVFTLRYEDLVLNTDKIISQLSTFLGVEVASESFDVNENTKVPSGMSIALNGIRKLDTNSVGVWKKHPLRVWNEFTNFREMHDIMKIFGYEETPNWFFKHFANKLPPINIE